MISSPAPEKFAVRILNDAGTYGPRHVKAINLDPANPNKHSSIPEAPIYGDLLEDLFIRQSSTAGGPPSLLVALRSREINSKGVERAPPEFR